MVSKARCLGLALVAAIGTTALTASVANAKWHDKHHEDEEWDHDDGRCHEVVDRIRLDQSKIHELEGSGHHKKALQWFRDDLDSAKHDYHDCRHRG